MLAKYPEARPSAVRVYDALLPFITTLNSPNGSPVTADRPAVSSTPGDGRDPVRPFRAPLLAPVHDPAATAEDDVPLTSAEADFLLQTAASYLDADRPADAVQVLTDGIARTRQDPGLQLHLRHILGGALLAAGRYTLAAAEFESVGRIYRERAHRSPNDPDVLDCAYQAGIAYAETGKLAKALPQLRFYVENAKIDINPGQALQVLQARFIIAQLRAADGRPDQALADLRALRPAFVSAYGASSTQVRNLDKQADRFSQATSQN
jgi:tetratricopeptide (TPR) repeat protein